MCLRHYWIKNKIKKRVLLRVRILIKYHVRYAPPRRLLYAGRMHVVESLIEPCVCESMRFFRYRWLNDIRSPLCTYIIQYIHICIMYNRLSTFCRLTWASEWSFFVRIYYHYNRYLTYSRVPYTSMSQTSPSHTPGNAVNPETRNRNSKKMFSSRLRASILLTANFVHTLQTINLLRR